jgi:hypothetical protein
MKLMGQVLSWRFLDKPLPDRVNITSQRRVIEEAHFLLDLLGFFLAKFFSLVRRL